MNLFLDTNTFLSFYLFSKDSLDNLEELANLIKSKEIKLLLPCQVIEEIRRNREQKIYESLKSLKDQFPKPQIPRIAEAYREFDELLKIAGEAEGTKKELLRKINNDIENKSLAADKLIDEIINNSSIIELNDSVIQAVHLRTDKGNPPGKKGSLGDAIIWETILQYIPFAEDLFFVSNDGDFTSPLNKEKLNKFLEDEFVTHKESKIIFYRSLAEFLNVQFADIQIEIEIDPAIEFEIWRLENSSSFSQTHLIIGELSKFEAFTDEQVKRILDICLNNSQVLRIINDSDVKLFIKKLIDRNSIVFDPIILRKIETIWDSTSLQDDDPRFFLPNPL